MGGAGGEQARPVRQLWLRMRESKYLFLLPWLIGLLAFTLGPFLSSLVLSFTDYDLFRPPNWTALDNYVRMFTADRRFWQSLAVTLLYVGVSVPLSTAAALGVALMLTRSTPATYAYRAIYYLPSLLGGSVAIAILWRQVFGRDGLVNAALALVGIDGPTWLTNPDYAIVPLIVLNVWQFGIPMVLFIAGLKQVPQELYDAATIDGANAVQRFRDITLPMLTPIILLSLVFQVINSFQAFTQAYIISGGTGGPSDSTLFFTLYIYQEGFSRFRMGYASALSWILLAVTALVSAALFYFSRRWVYYADD
jgi:multiple sugar transport system permease protein